MNAANTCAVVEDQFNDLIEDIEKVRIDLTQGETAGIKTLSGRMKSLGDAFADLTDEEQARLRPLMDELNEDMQRLSTELIEISAALAKMEID